MEWIKVGWQVENLRITQKKKLIDGLTGRIKSILSLLLHTYKENVIKIIQLFK